MPVLVADSDDDDKPKYVTKVRRRNQWMCMKCQNNWKQKKGGSRMVEIFAWPHVLQLVLDEPPTQLWNQWGKARKEFYKRVEPHAAIRDEAPCLTTSQGTTHRIRFTGESSTKIWNIMLTDPDITTQEKIYEIVRTSLEGQRFLNQQKELRAPHESEPGVLQF